MAKKLNTSTEVIVPETPVSPMLLTLRERLDTWRAIREDSVATIQETLDKRLMAIIEHRMAAMLDVVGGE